MERLFPSHCVDARFGSGGRTEEPAPIAETCAALFDEKIRPVMRRGIIMLVHSKGVFQA